MIKKLIPLIFLFLGSWTHGQGVTPDVVCNVVTGVATGVGAGTCIASPATCNGVANDAPAFAAFNTWAIGTWQASHTGYIELFVPFGSTCMFISAGSGTRIGQGIKQLIISGYGATLSDNNGTGNGFFLGAFESVIQDASHSARLSTVTAGSSTITLTETGTGCAPTCISLANVGDTLLVTGLDMQGEGFPPNPFYYEYMTVQSVNAGAHTITFTTPLTNTYKSTWPLNNAGSAFEADQGGPATVYFLNQNWKTTQEYRGFTLSQAGQTYAIGQSITYRDVISTGGACPIPTQNGLWQYIGGSMTGCAIEVDKLNDQVVMQNTTVRRLNFQSSSVNTWTNTNVNVTLEVTGTPKKFVATGSNLASMSAGATGYGRTNEISLTNTILTRISEAGANQDHINLRGTWVNGLFTVPHNFVITSAANNGSGLIRLLVDSTAGYSTNYVTDVVRLSGSGACNGTWLVTVIDATHFDLQGSTFAGTCGGNGGSLPLRWAVPGTNFDFSGPKKHETVAAQVTDLTQDATNTYVTTNLPGAGFPSIPLAAGAATINVHPAPKFTCVSCTGGLAAVDLSNSGAQGQPLWSYSKRIVTTTNGVLTQSQSCTLTNGSAVIACTDLSRVQDTMFTTGTGITPSTYIVSISGNNATLSDTVSVSGAQTITFTQGIVPMWGALTSLSMTVTAASTAGGAMTVSPNDPFVQTNGVQTDWNPIVNAKIASATPRIMTQTTTSGPQSGDSLVAPGATTLLYNNQISNQYVSTPATNDPVSTTMEFITNQNVVNP